MTSERDFDWTPRQRQVLALIAAERSNAEIGRELGISLDGAKWHVSEVMSKLGVSTREEAAVYWRRERSLSRRVRRPRALAGMLSPRLAAVAGAGAVALFAVFVVFARRGDESWLPMFDGEWSGDLAGAGGVLVREGNCLYVVDGSTWVLPAWPRQVTSWDESRQLLTYSGMTYALGDHIHFNGGGLGPESLTWPEIRAQPGAECREAHAFVVGRPPGVANTFVLPIHSGEREGTARLSGMVVTAGGSCTMVDEGGMQVMVAWPAGTRWDEELHFLEFRGERYRLQEAIDLDGAWYEGSVWLDEEFDVLPYTGCDTTRVFLATGPG